MRETAATVVRVQWPVINTIGDIINSEYNELASSILTHGDLSHAHGSGANALRSGDCREYHNFIHITALKFATPFMNVSLLFGYIIASEYVV